MSVHCILFFFPLFLHFVLCFMYRFSTLFISNLVLFLWAWAAVLPGFPFFPVICFLSSLCLSCSKNQILTCLAPSVISPHLGKKDFVFSVDRLTGTQVGEGQK
ncbi:hypothetical protein IscW_ISCW009588 [Ixodes scapularis]|uniref:Uncharacterized protein n=1 Tax=Ixodes scapularis TaxID=6945 RepID=B7Q3I3_IXOSC|nr:hypothetical protein IscW_ISCW009588 [Ixodes scapularis]|eukprot:XP_002411281.1 hypothetical protein IscW_ISCW009588 [Ixodes scapularis]